MARNGQLVTVKVRPNPTARERYELVYGHRRFLAAKKLGWKTIRAEVVDANDEDVLKQSLVENFEREGISDYEKACIFSTLNTKFNKTYEEIGKSLGISKQHVGSYIAMLRLFDNAELSNPELATALHRITEHHARVLSRVSDKKTRADLTIMATRQNLSVRDLGNMISHLRSWFPTGQKGNAKNLEQLGTSEIEEVGSTSDVENITHVVFDEFKLAQSGDFEAFKKLHLGSGFTLFPSYPPFERSEDTRALSREREWFYGILPKYSWKIEDLKITVLGRTALSTLKVKYFGSKGASDTKRLVRGTMVFVKRGDSWKILHEHWSRVRKTSRQSRAFAARLPHHQIDN